MTDNVTQIPKNNNKKAPKSFKRVMLFVFVFLGLVQLYKFYTGPSLLERRHDVRFFRGPIDISGNIFGSLDGKFFQFGDLTGRNVIIAFWAPWCGHCKNEIPEMSSLTGQLGQIGYEVIPLTQSKESKKEINYFFRNIKDNRPYISGDADLFTKLRVSGIPKYVLVNENAQAVAYMRPNWYAGDVLKLFSDLRESTLMQGRGRFQDPLQR